MLKVFLPFHQSFHSPTRRYSNTTVDRNVWNILYQAQTAASNGCTFGKDKKKGGEAWFLIQLWHLQNCNQRPVYHHFYLLVTIWTNQWTARSVACQWNTAEQFPEQNTTSRLQTARFFWSRVRWPWESKHMKLSENTTCQVLWNIVVFSEMLLLCADHQGHRTKGLKCKKILHL